MNDWYARESAVRDATAIVAALVKNGGYKSLTDKEIMVAILSLADEIIYPYIVEGKIADTPSPGGQEEIDNGAPF